MAWELPVAAPQDPVKLPPYINEQFANLSRSLEESYRPIFCVIAEKGGLLVAGAYEWSFGASQAYATGEGIVIPFPCAMFALSLFLNGGAARAKIDVDVDGVVATAHNLDLTASNKGFLEFPIPLECFPGETFSFHTVTQSGTSGNNVVAAWFRTR